MQRDFCAESEVNGNLHFGTTVSVGRGKEEYFCSSSFTNIVNAFVFANICQYLAFIAYIVLGANTTDVVKVVFCYVHWSLFAGVQLLINLCWCLRSCF